MSGACEHPTAPEDAALCALASGWEREAFRMPWLLGDEDPRAKTLKDCGDELRALVIKLFRQPRPGVCQCGPCQAAAREDDFVQNRHADLDPNAGEADDR